MTKVLIIAKYADSISQQLFGRKPEDFVLQDSIYDSFTGRNVGVQQYYLSEDRKLAELHLSKCRLNNLSVGYDLVEVEIM